MLELNAEGVGQFQPSGWSAATTLGQEGQNVLTLKALGVCGNNPVDGGPPGPGKLKSCGASPANEGVTATRSKPEAGAEMLPLLLLLRQEIDEARILAKVVEVGVALE